MSLIRKTQSPGEIVGDTDAGAQLPLVLAVDDDPINLSVIAGALEPLGYRVGFARSGADALAAMRRERPQLVLLDVMMPGVNGMDLCLTIRADADMGDVPVMLVTALGAQDSRLEGLIAGADDYLEKPIDIDELVSRVRSLIARVPAAGSGFGAPGSVRRPAEAAAMSAGFDLDNSVQIGIAATLLQAARASVGESDAGKVAAAMAKAAGLPRFDRGFLEADRSPRYATSIIETALGAAS